VALSILVAVFAVRLQRRLQLTHGNLDAALLAVAIYVVLMALAFYALPTVDEVPAGFSASLLWKFRVAAIGIQAVIWTTLGLGFGALARRQLEPAAARRIASA
jgi:Probable cobalt transporter subunit (CbtA)